MATRELGARITAAERRDLLLDAAADLAVSESVDAVTMDVVAERCGVSRPLVYKHFSSRDELLVALYQRESLRVHEALSEMVRAEQSIEAMFRALINGSLQASADSGHLFAVLRGAAGSTREVRREQRARDSRTFRAFVKRASDELGLADDVSRTAVSLLLSLVDGVIAQWRQAPTPARAKLLEAGYMTIVSATLDELSSRR